MSEILIVEDNKMTALNMVAMANKIDSSVNALNTGYAEDALRLAVERNFKAFFFDIQLKDYSGIELAKKIRKIKRYEFTPIIFITALPNKELDAYRKIHCYDYIVKPFNNKEVEVLFRKILINYISDNVKETKKLKLKYKSCIQLVDFEDILYIEYKDRKIYIRTMIEDIEFIHMSMRKFRELLSDDFIQIHQAFVVNKNYIETINLKEKSIQLKLLEVEIPVGRSFMKDLEESV